MKLACSGLVASAQRLRLAWWMASPCGVFVRIMATMVQARMGPSLYKAVGRNCRLLASGRRSGFGIPTGLRAAERRSPVGGLRVRPIPTIARLASDPPYSGP